MNIRHGIIAIILATMAFQTQAGTTPAKEPPPLKPFASITGPTPPAISQKTVSQSIARRLVAVAVDICHVNGYAVSATVVDRSGTPLAMTRADNAGKLSLASSERNALNAANFNVATSVLLERGDNAAPTMSMAGGVPVRSGNEIIGAIGVSGAADGRIDEQCASYALKFLAKQFAS